jgi:hypothetical protein
VRNREACFASRSQSLEVGEHSQKCRATQSLVVAFSRARVPNPFAKVLSARQTLFNAFDDEPRLMSERQKQADFIKQLLACDDCQEHRHLQEQLAASEKDERCLRRACRLVVVVTMLALAALGYLTLLPMQESNARIGQVLLNCFQVLALGSGMCLGVFVALVFWQRSVTQRLYEEGRHFITAQVQNRAHTQQPTDVFPTLVVHESDTAMYQVRTPTRNSGSAEVITLPTVS